MASTKKDEDGDDSRAATAAIAAAIAKREEELKRMMVMREMEKENNNKPQSSSSYHHFRLFSYMSMAILSIAILVGMFLIVQHLTGEDTEKKTLANQETLIENQELLLILNKNQSDNIVTTATILNETRRDNSAFFGILDGMIKAEKNEFISIDTVNEKVDKIMEYLNITAAAAPKD